MHYAYVRFYVRFFKSSNVHGYYERHGGRRMPLKFKVQSSKVQNAVLLALTGAVMHVVHVHNGQATVHRP